MNAKAALAVCLTIPMLFAIIHCGGGGSSSPTRTSPTPAPTVAPTPPPPVVLVCDPTPPPLHGVKVKIHDNSGYRKIMDSRPLVENIDRFCQRTGQHSGKFCFTRLEGDPQQADCDRMAMGMADTGRYGPTWSFDGNPCTDAGPDPGCYHHASNQFLTIAKGSGSVKACAADDVPVAADSCGGCRISETVGGCQ